MNIKEVSSKKLFKEYELQIPYNEVDELINEKILKLIPTVSISGFRKGKAPLSIVKKKYENSILNEVIEKIVEKNTKNLLEEKKIKAYRQPKVELKKYEKDKPIEISVKVDIDPNITISSFKEINLIQRSIKLNQKKIDENYKNFTNSQKHYHKVSDVRSVKLSDKVFVNLETEDKVAPEHLRLQKNISIITDSDYQVLPDISLRLIEKKAKVGDIIKIKFDLSKILKIKQKKEVEFSIEILSLEHMHEFKVTKEFLEKNNLKDELELKQNLKDSLIKQYDEYLKQIQKKELMDMLDKNNKFDVPEALLEEEFDSIWRRLEHAKKENQLDEDDKNLTDPELKKRYKKIALRRVKLAILMQKIATDNKITISEKELTDGMLNYASQYPGQEKQIFEYFKKNPSNVETIRGPLFEEKIIDHIVTNVKIIKEEIEVKKFEKLQEDTFNNKDVE
jgi:trigger factor